ncbi:2-dehydro-3-deoxy-6-phosphogalactonate aldolase [Arenibaculum sp.]|jgi:2-dehydro-3-deoxyphosphogalactonate aldolase|uniref:2-dehydro-3-deoxy-6-phosphogalactonate aldolase n=1 Tax=Arenibaculum sp. TaxID=2865862 RepID=UPI002E1359B0|nr:2-dehydro-3-deoxy-6-phosphogalactonate aldolase [Arenibaculum sp.]
MNASSGPGAVPWPPLARDLVAILRGVRPQEVEAIGIALAEAGFGAVEVPLNSPDPLTSIARLRAVLPDRVLVGAGTVLSAAEVDAVRDAGGGLVVSPNVDPEVVARTVANGMVSLPGVFTPTEALTALKAGASALKVFPAFVLGPAGIAAIRAVLPATTAIAAVGGVGEGQFAAYARAGVRAFGLGSSLYRPGDGAQAVAARARAAVAAFDAAFGTLRA